MYVALSWRNAERFVLVQSKTYRLSDRIDLFRIPFVNRHHGRVRHVNRVTKSQRLCFFQISGAKHVGVASRAAFKLVFSPATAIFQLAM